MKCLTNLCSLTIVAMLTAGCGQPSAPAPEPDAAAPEQVSAPVADEHHHGAGPHGGTLGDWGGGTYHVEFTVDHDKQQSTVYVLGDDAKTPAPVNTDKLLLSITEPAFEVELTAVPLADEPAGSSSRFVGKHETLGKVQEFSGTIIGEVDGTPYAGDFQEQAANHAH